MMPRFFFISATLALVGLGAYAAEADQLAVVCDPVPALTETTSAEDAARESAYCAIDLSRDDVAICPKTWSTSPGAVIYDLAGTEWQGRVAAFEQSHCGPGGNARDLAAGELAIFKNTLNGRETSGTFSPAASLYYHFSRLLQTRVQVPVAARVAFDLPAYQQRVIQPGVVFSDSPRRKMLHAGWQEMAMAAEDPAAYSHKRELFSSDLGQLWGVLLMSEGRRYGPELNGTRASGWGDGQNLDFQKTAPFIALRTDLPLKQAIQQGIVEARADAAMASSLPVDTSPAQVASWMHDITEIVILDYILKQQDRIGNVDYLDRWHWLEAGQLRHSAAKPTDKDAIQLKVSVLNDNDAGVRSGYANYAKRTDMLAGWRHMSPDLYQRVQSLATEFAKDGALAEAVRSNYRLSRREAQGIVTRTVELAAALKQSCEAGDLRFDLTDTALIDPAAAVPEAPGCSKNAMPVQAVSERINAE